MNNRSGRSSNSDGKIVILQPQMYKNNTHRSTIKEVTEPEPVLDFQESERDIV